MSKKYVTARLWAVLAVVIAGLISPVSSSGAGSADAKMPVAKIGDNLIKLEVASSEQEIEKGLMYRTSLPEDQGMVFLFHPPRKVNFWMCHTLIALDMLFVDKGKIVKIFHDVPPCKSPNCTECPTYPSGEGQHVTEVIEVNGGYAARHAVKEGDKVEIDIK
jgi:uncharacterized membrane protein (UPF0127 family)